ncbi:unnamed protein product [Caenorhabditis auriculariae]|uniref:Translocation protein SEC62 n=1 Tax=Caenorhabditis auriculariae TaxID=2777116 RepID=A0A8S1HGV8_9PELO|nr:unnamed protein product [Caenorhabditis auriculariae]
MSKRKEKAVEDDSQLTKEQTEIAKFLRFNCPSASTLFEGNEVHYFSGNKAVDTLLESKYGNKGTKNVLFKTREDATHYISDLFSKQLFFRAKKLVPKKKEDKEVETAGDTPKSPKKDGEKRKKGKERKEEETVTETEADERKKDDDEEKKDSKDEEKKKKKKVKLLVHNIQVFVDEKDVYVWVFDPTPLYKKVIGVLMLVGTIGVYYLSLGGIGVFASIVVVAILRTILFGIIWLLTMGQHKLWILPNLTEDCGVIESFKPFYTYEYCPRNSEGSKPSKGKKKSKKEKDSDNEENKDDEPAPPTTEEKERDSSVEDDFDKIDDVDKSEGTSEDDDGEEAKNSENQSSAHSTPEEKQAARKRRPAKV